MTGGMSPTQGDRKGRICVTCVPTLRKRPGVVRPAEKETDGAQDLPACVVQTDSMAEGECTMRRL